MPIAIEELICRSQIPSGQDHLGVLWLFRSRDDNGCNKHNRSAARNAAISDNHVQRSMLQQERLAVHQPRITSSGGNHRGGEAERRKKLPQVWTTHGSPETA